MQAHTTDLTPVRCDNVIWDRRIRSNVRCNRLLGRMYLDGASVVELSCLRCGKTRRITAATMPIDIAA